MKLWVMLLLCTASSAYAQNKPVEGIVFDKDVKDRIAKVNVRNQASGKSVYNNLKGEFTIDAATGDKLIFSKEGYRNDTVTVANARTLAVYLKRSGIQLKEVVITDTAMTPEKRLEATKRDFTKIYGASANPDLLTSAPFGGAGIGIDALYNALSKSGRNAAKLKEIIERDYKQDVIDYRFNRALVANITGLKETQLTDFMQKYRPGYYFVTTASEYEFVRYIRNNYRRYMRNPRNFSLPTLDAAK